MAEDVFIQVGTTAMRAPNGDFLPSVPLFIKADELRPSGLTKAEENTLRGVTGLFFKKHQALEKQKNGIKE